MDCLTFGCGIQIKGIKTKKDPVIELNLSKILEEFEFTMDQFVDFCILSGCDYLPTIAKFGPATAFKYIKMHKTIEKVLEVIKEENEEFIKKKGKPKYIIPSDFDYETARDLFKNPSVHT